MIAAIVAAAMLPAALAAECGSRLRDISFHGDRSGPYTDSMALSDFEPYWFMDLLSTASVTEMDGDRYLEVLLPKGCVSTRSDRSCGMRGFVPLTNLHQEDDVTLEFTIRFADDFDWVKGGKLVGLCSDGCPTGCDRPSTDGSDGFSARVMWGKEGELYLYTYSGDMVTDKCGEDTKSSEPGLARAERGVDNKVRLYVRMNSPGSSDGIIVLWLNGVKIVEKVGMLLRAVEDQKIDWFVMHNFFGGNDDSWAAVKDERIYYKEFETWGGYCEPGSGESGGDESGGGGEGGWSGLWGGWKPEHVGSLESAHRTLAVKPLDVYSASSETWCSIYTIANEDSVDCKEYGLELNIDPARFTLMHTPGGHDLQKEAEDEGYWYFTNYARVEAGGTKSGTICGVNKFKGQYSRDTITAAVDIRAFCTWDD